MTDRELLELAAKAAGYDGEYSEACQAVVVFTKDISKSFTWNPLTDDGDALRLAVNRHINLVFEAYVVVASTELNKSVVVSEYTTNYITVGQATRRAIVRAAAEIGKEMK